MTFNELGVAANEEELAYRRKVAVNRVGAELIPLTRSAELLVDAIIKEAQG